MLILVAIYFLSSLSFYRGGNLNAVLTNFVFAILDNQYLHLGVNIVESICLVVRLKHTWEDSLKITNQHILNVLGRCSQLDLSKSISYIYKSFRLYKVISLLCYSVLIIIICFKLLTTNNQNFINF